MPSINALVTRGYGFSVSDILRRGYQSSVRRNGAGSGNKKKNRSSWWVSVGGKSYKVTSIYQEQELLKSYINDNKSKIEALGKSGNLGDKKGKALKASLRKAIDKLNAIQNIQRHNQEINDLFKKRMKEEEIILMFLTLH